MKISKLEGKRVALWGWGREGRAAFAVLRERLPTLPLSLFCPAAEVGAARVETQGALDVRGEPSAEALAAFDVVIKSPGISPYQPIALAADFLAIAVSELANIAERRTQLLLDKNHNRNLPANLIPKRGVNSGLMLSQYCAAGLVSENKVLAHPAAVDSIPTSANAEDHNAMASIAARSSGMYWR